MAFSACASTLTSGVSHDEAPHPEGVSVDLVSASTQPHAQADADNGLLVLSTPVSTAAIVRLVDHLFRAIASEDLEALDGMVAPEALASPVADPSQAASGSSQPILRWFEHRFRRLDYAALEAQALVRMGDLQIEPERPQRREQATAGVETVLVRAVPLTTRVGHERLFADSIVLRIRVSGSRLEVVRWIEDFQIP